VTTKLKSTLDCCKINLNSSGDHESRLTQKKEEISGMYRKPRYCGQYNRLSGEFMPKINNVEMG
jgi:hypothetical protein